MAKQRITLLLSRNCNLQCSFCYQREHSEHKSQNMKIEDLKKIIDKYLYDSDVIFNLFGGEPFLNKEAMVYLVENYGSLERRFETTTNVLAVDIDIFEKMVKKNMFYKLSFSLDVVGGEERYNSNQEREVVRKIKKMLKILRENKGVEVSVRVVYGRKTFDKMFETYVFYSKLRDEYFKQMGIGISFDTNFDINEEESNKIINLFEKIEDFEIKTYGEIKLKWSNLGDKSFFICDHRKKKTYNVDGLEGECYHFEFDKPKYDEDDIFDNICKSCKNPFCKICIFEIKNKCFFYKKLLEWCNDK